MIRDSPQLLANDVLRLMRSVPARWCRLGILSDRGPPASAEFLKTVYRRHSRWDLLARWMRFPDAEDQRAVHDWIYQLQIGEAATGGCTWLDGLALKYGVDGFVFACTELHLCQQVIAPRPAGEDGFNVIDPLLTAARRLQDPGWCYAGSERPEFAEAPGA